MQTSRYFDPGEVSVVTGAARGIGLAAARRLASEGVAVALVDIDEVTGVQIRDEFEAQGWKASFHPCDVSRSESVDKTIADVLAQWGRIDSLVNCAGIAGRSVPIWDVTDDEWRTLMGIDLDSVFYFCRSVIPHMQGRGYGRIVNVASIAGKEGNPNAVAYSAAKAGVIGLTKAVAKEVAKDGILVNSVAPAVIMTPILEQVSEEHINYMLQRIPLGRPGRPEEAAALIAWLCSKECSFSTGACYDLSGGRATY